MRDFYVEPCRSPKSRDGGCVRRALADGDGYYECRETCKYVLKEGLDTATQEEYGVEVQVPNDQETGRDKQ